MHSFKSALLFVTCISYTLAQLDSYNQLTSTDLQENCENNNVNLTELATIHEKVNSLREKKTDEMTIKDALKTDDNCMGSELKTLLQEEMKIVQKCLKGNITLSKDDINTLITESIKRLCALSRLTSFEHTLSSCIDTDKQSECETKVLEPVESLENTEEFANLGLSYSKAQKQIWEDLFKCSTKAIENCSEEEKKTHLKLTSNTIDLHKTKN
ncbi:uncharacterized protein LOC127287890 [Leptopilina boulardi]|uniref:uncharacterized protein LOC127287890 n=1 Tax=Leptopilina boulardi TaxID=63433 RepID=UPI0021F54174|nr:uncharacterized protein LOC127287890 [Leptopilina boulardi]